MATPPIIIVGAGLAGLVLGRCLKNKGIPATIFEKASSAPRYNYGITLYPWSYKPLLHTLEMDEATFHQRLRVDALRAVPEVDFDDQSASETKTEPSGFRCHRGRLEDLLREGQDIRWEHSLENINILPSRNNEPRIAIRFKDRKPLETPVLIGADGVHSQIRTLLAPSMKTDMLPYVVFYGRRRIRQSEYLSQYAPQLSGSPVFESRHGNVLLQISLCDHTTEDIDINYVYSRPAALNDHLHNPDRTNSQATQIPEAFYAELEALHHLKTPLKETFDPGKVRQDRVLHWLMRRLPGHDSELRRLAEQRVLLVGDAAHAMPILGGCGANVAIRDGVELAEYILQHGVKNLGSFLETRLRSWGQSINDCNRRLREMHAPIEAMV